jgi:hypothetical protein
MSVAIQDGNLSEVKADLLSPFECSYPGPFNVRWIARIRLAFIGVAAHIA